jgi:hypothetical protein
LPVLVRAELIVAAARCALRPMRKLPHLPPWARAFAARLVAPAQLRQEPVSPERAQLSGSLLLEKLRYRPRIYRVLVLPAMQQPRWHVRVLPEEVRVPPAW